MAAVSEELIPIERVESEAAAETWHRLLALVLDSVSSPHTRRAYRDALEEFALWCRVDSGHPFTRATVQKYRAELQEKGLAPSSINVRLSAIRKLAQEAADNGLLRPEIAGPIVRVRGARRHGIRLGQWLTKEQAQQLLALPSGHTLKERRDRALLALIVGSGVRRSEAARLRMEDVQKRDGRWVLADLIGKHGRVRTVPIADWTKQTLDDWTLAAGVRTGLVFRRVTSGGRILDAGISPQTVFDTVRAYSCHLGVSISPHDLRRTFARLAYSGQAKLEQVQLTLGHASLTTTEAYLGVRQDLEDAPCDHLGLGKP